MLPVNSVYMPPVYGAAVIMSFFHFQRFCDEVDGVSEDFCGIAFLTIRSRVSLVPQTPDNFNCVSFGEFVKIVNIVSFLSHDIVPAGFDDAVTLGILVKVIRRY